MLRLLDRAAQLTNFKWETPDFGPLTYEPALQTPALAATLLFAHGQPRSVRLPLPSGLVCSRRDGQGAALVGRDHRRARWRAARANRPRQTARCRHGQDTGGHDRDRSDLERCQRISDHHGHDLRADPPAHAVRARTARSSMKSGMDVLCTAAPFKITRRRRAIPYHRVVCPRDRGVFP
jgi:hypothetical protein